MQPFHRHPFIRHREANFGDADGDRLDIGVNSLIKSYNALVTAVWANQDDLAGGDAGQDFNIFRLGVRVQF